VSPVETKTFSEKRSPAPGSPIVAVFRREERFHSSVPPSTLASPPLLFLPEKTKRVAFRSFSEKSSRWLVRTSRSTSGFTLCSTVSTSQGFLPGRFHSTGWLLHVFFFSPSLTFQLCLHPLPYFSLVIYSHKQKQFTDHRFPRRALRYPPIRLCILCPIAMGYFRRTSAKQSPRLTRVIYTSPRRPISSFPALPAFPGFFPNSASYHRSNIWA